MTVKHVSITSKTAFDLDFDADHPICILQGENSDTALDLIREVIGDFFARNDPDRIDDGRCVIHADVEISGKNYGVCYLRNADFMNDNRIAVNFGENSLDFDRDATQKYLERIKKLNLSDQNVFYSTHLAENAQLLSQSDKILFDFEKFVRMQSASDDTRPLFIYGLFDRLDQSTDLEKIFCRLAMLGRQVFICAEKCVCLENFENIAATRVDMGTLCPICGEMRLGFHEICKICNWQNDGFAEDRYSCANKSTAVNYRENYLKRKRHQ
jgi:hypothetical protein